MTREEFERLISNDPALALPVRSATKAAMTSTRRSFAAPTELALIAVAFPVVTFIVKHIGLPWLHEVKRYSELWRQKFHNWIDQEYQKQGFDPDEAEAIGEKLRQELHAVTESDARKSWERFAEILKQENQEEEI